MVKQYIPFTDARRERLFGLALQHRVGDHDGVVAIEWPDGTVSLKPVDYDEQQNKLVGEDEAFEVKLKGLGSEPKEFFGVPLWHCEARNYGVISTQATLIADRERRGDGIYEGEDALGFLFERYIEELQDYARAEYADAADDGGSGDAAIADGGTAAVSAQQAAMDLANKRADGTYRTLADWINETAPEDLTVYDLRPPEDADAQVFSVREATEFDPYPVLREEASRAVDWAEQAATDEDQWWSGFITALVVAGALYLLFRIVPAVIGWMLGAIAGNGGGGRGNSVPGLTILPDVTGVLPQAASLAPDIAGLLPQVAGVLL